uniref:Uncharacterized protein n=1 Tax=Gossypium raimondii TaxID=29730 RepID=A0A0D2NJD2_GOSRA|nr:hypothetical protein B456_006G112900 [Gossypium raimondii]
MRTPINLIFPYFPATSSSHCCHFSLLHFLSHFSIFSQNFHYPPKYISTNDLSIFKIGFHGFLCEKMKIEGERFNKVRKGFLHL